jgi:integrase
MARKISREIGRLSARKVATITKPGRYHDGGGLYLQITESGTRSWLFRYSTGTRKTRAAHWMGLGPVSIVTLVDARQAAADLRRQRWEGKDPLGERRARQAAVLEAAKAVTFKTAAALYISSHQPGWRNAEHGRQWKATLEAYAEPVIGSLPVQAVDTALVLKALEPIWATKTETASRVRGRIESVLDWATARSYRRGDNPARWKGHLQNLLPARAKVQPVVRHRALPYAQIGEFMAKLREQEGTAADALEFLILTSARTGEAIGATWSEIDLGARTWTVPAARIKAGKEHRVPLSAPAVAILKRMADIRQGDAPYVFPSRSSVRPLGDSAIRALLKRMNRVDMTTHGCRATFRTWAAECMTSVPREIAEQCLGHVTAGAVEQAYLRSDHFERRRLFDGRLGRVVRQAGKGGQQRRCHRCRRERVRLSRARIVLR